MSVSFEQVAAKFATLPYDLLGTDSFSQVLAPFENPPMIQINPEGAQSRVTTDFSFDACVKAVTRLVAGLFLLPIFATIGTLYHLGLGLTSFGLAAYGHFAEKLNAEHVKNHCINGTEHLIASIYNLAVTVLSPVVAVAYAANGIQLARKHDDFNEKAHQWAQAIVNKLLGPGSYEMQEM